MTAILDHTDVVDYVFANPQRALTPVQQKVLIAAALGRPSRETVAGKATRAVLVRKGLIDQQETGWDLTQRGLQLGLQLAGGEGVERAAKLRNTAHKWAVQDELVEDLCDAIDEMNHEHEAALSAVSSARREYDTALEAYTAAERALSAAQRARDEALATASRRAKDFDQADTRARNLGITNEQIAACH